MLALILNLSLGLKGYMVYCDASKACLRYMLIQHENVVACGSQQLKNNEKNYLTHELKMVIIIFKLKQWNHYLYGKTCKIFIDYNILKYIFEQA